MVIFLLEMCMIKSCKKLCRSLVYLSFEINEFNGYLCGFFIFL